MTDPLQVLHTLLCTQPPKDDTIQAWHTYAHATWLKKSKALMAYLRNCVVHGEVLLHLLFPMFGVMSALFAGRKIAPSKTSKCTNHPDLHHLKDTDAGTISGIGT